MTVAGLIVTLERVEQPQVSPRFVGVLAALTRFLGEEPDLIEERMLDLDVERHFHVFWDDPNVLLELHFDGEIVVRLNLEQAVHEAQNQEHDWRDLYDRLQMIIGFCVVEEIPYRLAKEGFDDTGEPLPDRIDADFEDAADDDADLVAASETECACFGHEHRAGPWLPDVCLYPRCNCTHSGLDADSRDALNRALDKDD